MNFLYKFSYRGFERNRSRREIGIENKSDQTVSKVFHFSNSVILNKAIRLFVNSRKSILILK